MTSSLAAVHAATQHRKAPIMKWKTFIASVALGYAATAPSSNAQAVRAVTFAPNSAGSPGTWLSNSGIGISSPPSGQSGRARWSCFVWLTAFGPNEERTLFESTRQGSPGSKIVMAVGLESTTNAPEISNGVHIKMEAHDGSAGAGQIMTALSRDSLPVGQGKWIHIQGGWDTNIWLPMLDRYAVAATINSKFVEWDSLYTGGSFDEPSAGFLTPYQNSAGSFNGWTHGADQNPATGTVSQFINGDLAECYFNSYLPGGGTNAFAVLDLDTGQAIPLSLGPLCMAPSGTIPQLCFQGGSLTYSHNNHDALNPLTMSPFTVNGTPLVTAPDDPFQ